VGHASWPSKTPWAGRRAHRSLSGSASFTLRSGYQFDHFGSHHRPHLKGTETSLLRPLTLDLNFVFWSSRLTGKAKWGQSHLAPPRTMVLKLFGSWDLLDRTRGPPYLLLPTCHTHKAPSKWGGSCFSWQQRHPSPPGSTATLGPTASLRLEGNP
jgi:hypothetical protein